MVNKSLNSTAKLKHTPLGEIAEIHARVTKAFNSGVTLPLAYRRRQLLQVARLLRENTPAIEAALYEDLRKPKLEVGLGETEFCIGVALRAAENLAQWAKPEKPKITEEWRSNWDATIYKVPKGQSLIIVPWNYPIALCFNPLVGAIAAGCPCVVKMSELSPATSALIGELFAKYLDPEAYTVVNGAIPEAARLLDLKWSHIFFTGSTTVGRIVATAAAKHLTPCTLELGSKSPVIMDEEYDDLDLAAKRILNGKGMNAGQICISPDYVLVPRKRLEEAVASFKKMYSVLWPQSQLNPETEWSKIISPAHYERLMKLLAYTKGEVVMGGKHNEKEGKMALTIVNNVKPDDALMESETFGPILSLVPYDDVSEAISIINQRSVPLIVYAFTNSEAFKERLFYATRSGSLVFNDTVASFAFHELPFGGLGESGYGNYFGKFSFNTFTHTRTHFNVPAVAEPFLGLRYPPYTQQAYDALCPQLPIPEE